MADQKSRPDPQEFTPRESVAYQMAPRHLEARHGVDYDIVDVCGPTLLGVLRDHALWSRTRDGPLPLSSEIFRAPVSRLGHFGDYEYVYGQ